MAPDYSESNPYQAELIAALQDDDIEVACVHAHPWMPLLRGWIATGRPDRLHIHWITPFIGTNRWWISAVLGVRLLLEVMVLRLVGCRIVWTVHNLQAHEARNPRTDRTVRRLMAQLSHVLIAHCERARDRIETAYELAGRCPGPIEIIPHGHFGESYQTDLSRPAARQELDMSTEETMVLYVGNIRPYKNVPQLIESFKSVNPSGARLVVVGRPWTDSIRTDIEQRCLDDDRIHADLEFVPDSSLARYLTAADAVVLPFDGILTSGSVLLAMTFGRAVIVPDRGCPGELIGTAGGVAYEPDDPSGLERALEAVCSGTLDLDRMGARNRDLATSFRWESIARQTIDVYQS